MIEIRRLKSGIKFYREEIRRTNERLNEERQTFEAEVS